MPEPASPVPAPDPALQEAVSAILRPLARLAVERGLTHAAIDELTKRALVEAARELHTAQGANAERLTSRISMTTGLNRREVKRLETGTTPPPREVRSRAAGVFSHWCSDPDFLDAEGLPRRLPRQGPHPSFESLARLITQDVHPRSVLDELLRLKLAEVDDGDDSVVLASEAFVPVGDSARMLRFLGANVGDHLAAAVDNVSSGTPPHLERAVFAERFSEAAIETAGQWLSGHWTSLHAQLVPMLEHLLAADMADPQRVRDRRLRAGLYFYAAPVDAEVGPAPMTGARESTQPRIVEPPAPAKVPEAAAAARATKAKPLSPAAAGAAPPDASPRPARSRR